MSDTEEESPEENALIKAYLEENQSYHISMTGPINGPHSWPCSVWDTRPLKAGFCNKLVMHGLIPKNYAIIKPLTLGENDETDGHPEEGQ
ncbi:MAG: hypothetical protein EBU08_00395 [Micrococcales bacterium]|nr:hypothetical protein [Micrococcales bacterium]